VQFIINNRIIQKVRPRVSNNFFSLVTCKTNISVTFAINFPNDKNDVSIPIVNCQISDVDKIIFIPKFWKFSKLKSGFNI